MQDNNDDAVQKPVDQQEPPAAAPEANPLYTYASHIITGILIAACIAILIYRFSGKSPNKEIATTEKLFSARNAQDLELLVTENPSSEAAPLAMMKLAKVYFNAGNYDQAMGKYVEFKAKYPGHEWTAAAEIGTMHCLEARNQTEEALNGYTTFMSTQTNYFLFAQAVFGRARCLEQLGRHKEAIAVYEDFIAAHPKSAWALKAEDLMESLKKTTGQKKASG